MSEDLRKLVMRGGRYLVLRQGVGTIIAIAGVLLLTRIVGPRQYGLYAAAVGLFATLQLLTQLGITVFLIRRETALSDDVLHFSSTLMLLLGLAGAALGIATLPLVAQWTRLDGLTPIALAIYASLPIALLAQVPLAMLDRALNYRRTTWIELSAQASLFLVALPLAMRGLGAWAIVAGWWAQQLVNLTLLHVGARYFPKWHWEAGIAREVVTFGAAFSLSTWVHQLRRLVNPLIVGRYLGADAVAVVALTTQIVTNLGFVGVATWRLAMSALARVQSDPARLVRAINEGMQLQLLAVAPLLLLFGFAAPVLVPFALGDEWRPIIVVFPFIAAAYLAALLFNFHSATLYVRNRNGDVAVYHAAHTGLLAATALALVPSLGLVGYGLGELATLAGFIVLHQRTVKQVGALSYTRLAVPALATGIGLFYPWLGIWSIAAAIVFVIVMQPWRQVSAVRTMLKESV